MKRILLFLALAIICVSANAETPYKCLYAVAEVSPTGVGKVYLAAKNTTDAAYVKEQSEDLGESAFIKIVGAENGNGLKDGTTGELEDKSGSLKAADHLFEANLFYEPTPGYELVCLSNTISADGTYTADMCYSVIHGESLLDNRTFDFDYSQSPLRININSNSHPKDGNDQAGEGPTRDELFATGTWMATPDTYVYAIFRKVGDSTP